MLIIKKCKKENVQNKYQQNKSEEKPYLKEKNKKQRKKTT
jgi:hypothetical protein